MCKRVTVQPYGYFNRDEGRQSDTGTGDWTPNANFLMGDAKVFECVRDRTLRAVHGRVSS